jgi:RES domain-containing protein
MLLWRLSGKQQATAFDGGYGRHFNGRWNTVGHPVTYCATSPSLCVLEKLVHVEDFGLLPELIMIAYNVPDATPADRLELGALPSDWLKRETWTQQRGDAWLVSRASPLLKVPSVIVPLANSPDLNVLINHAHADAASITIAEMTGFRLDPRLF